MTSATASPNGTVPHALAPQHVLDLRRSGLTDETVEAAGLYTVTDPAEVARLLNWTGGGEKLGACLAFPFRAPDGQSSGYVRLKPDRPRANGGKYETAKGSANRAFFPPRTWPVLADAGQALLVTEGEKKSLAADQAGLPCVGLVGVYGWQVKRPRGKSGKGKGKRELIDLLAAVAWQGRQVFLAFDSDAATNPNVVWAEWHLAQVLQALGAVVRIVRLPEGPAGAGCPPVKVGLDDYLLAHG